jgi:predicted RNase H-like nuclease
VFAGLDGCRAGWFAVSATSGTGPIETAVFATFGEALASLPASTLIAVDIPIGLADRGDRVCDRMARQRLSPFRSSSVFPAPIRNVLDAATHADASARRHAVEGKRISIQAYAITKKVREVDTVLRSSPADRLRVFEVHPEVSFAEMNGGQALATKKRRASGRADRTALLHPYFGDEPTRVVQSRSPKRAVAIDDVLDAFAALWSAMRIGDGRAYSLPALSDRDTAGIPMAIFY